MDLTALLNTYRGPLIGLIASWGAPWGDAIEIAQDSFSDAWLKRELCRDDWNEPEVFGRWLRGVALNRYRNWSRSRWRRRLRMVTLAPAALEFAAAPSDPEPSEQVQALRRAIERLPAEQRQVVLMHYLEETSVRNVAGLLSVTVKTVEGRLYQARRTLPPTARQSGALTNRKVAAMSVTLVPEDDLRAALRPYRVDPGTFESAVRARVSDSVRHGDDPLASLSPAQRSAAAFLPLEFIAAGQMPAAAVKLVPGMGACKLLSYVAFPAISLFVLLGAAVFSIFKIRRIRDENRSAPVGEKLLAGSTRQWWHDNKWGVWLVFAASLAMAWFGATWLLFLCYIVSLGFLIFVLTSLARIGLGNRLIVCQSCVIGLGLLGQLAGFAGIGDQDIHLVDQVVIVPLFFCGALVVALIMVGSAIGSHGSAGGSGEKTRLIAPVALFAVFIMPLIVWFLNPILWPATPARIKAYVESFDRAPFSTASWHQWEIVASWAVDSGLHPDLSKPRQLLDAEITGEQNPLILGSAFRVGLVQVDQLGRLTDYARRRHILLDRPIRIRETLPLTSLDMDDWVIRAAVMRHDMTTEQRDYLEKRLHATLEAVSTGPHAVLKTPLRATQLLEVIERPVNPDRYRHKIHDLLRTFHSKKGGGFEVAGGFRDYNQGNVQVGSLEATSFAVKLMEFYGIPAGLDPNWVRSYLRPLFIRGSPQKFMAAVTLDRLNRLPDVTKPTWLETVYFERSLLAAVVLIGLCIYAALASPMPPAIGTNDGSSPAESFDDAGLV